MRKSLFLAAALTMLVCGWSANEAQAQQIFMGSNGASLPYNGAYTGNYYDGAYGGNSIYLGNPRFRPNLNSYPLYYQPYSGPSYNYLTNPNLYLGSNYSQRYSSGWGNGYYR